MGRARPLYRHPSGVYYARYYLGSRRVMLSLDTRDPAVAAARYAPVKARGKSWTQLSQAPWLLGRDVEPDEPTEPQTFEQQLESLLRVNKVDPATVALMVKLVREGPSAAKVDQWAEISAFWKTTVPKAYRAEARALGRAKYWLSYLESRSVRSWAGINEELVGGYKKWRESTTKAKAPTIEVEIAYLVKALALARDKGLMNANPIAHWHRAAGSLPTVKQEHLTVPELRAILADPEIRSIRDVVLMLFCGVKRRSEILNLGIPDVNFSEHWALYSEGKNQAKAAAAGDTITKAFWLTPAMEKLLRRVIGDRTSGKVFSADRRIVTELFGSVAHRVIPGKPSIHLHNLRHSATVIMEQAGVSEADQDYALGHFSVKKVLRHYQDRSPQAIARRLAPLTRPGIEAAAAVVADLL